MEPDFSTPWVLIDDADPSIRYIGSWVNNEGIINLSNPTINVTLEYQNPFLNTSHRTETISSNGLSYEFKGVSVAIYGAYALSDLYSGPLPWYCLIDGMKIPGNDQGAVFNGETGFIACSANNLGDGPHLLTLNLLDAQQVSSEFAPTQDGPSAGFFWIDMIAYIPSSNIQTQGTSVWTAVPSANNLIQYSSGWELYAYSNTTHSTTRENASIVVQFEGTSIAWVSEVFNDLPNDVTSNGTASYSIDGQDPIFFGVTPVKSFQDVTSSYTLFNVSQLSDGLHRLEVVYQGNSSVSPLTLTCLRIENSTSDRSVNADGHRSREIKIISAVVSVCTFLALIFGLLLFLRRRNKCSASPINPTISAIHPFVDSSREERIDSGSAEVGPAASAMQHQGKGPGPMDSQINNRGMASGALRPNKIRRLAFSVATSIRHVGHGTHTASAYPPVNSTPADPISNNQSISLVMIHEDSGMRQIEPQQHASVTEAPPMYTAN